MRKEVEIQTRKRPGSSESSIKLGGSGADGTRGRAYDTRVFCDLRDSKTTFLPGMGGR